MAVSESPKKPSFFKGFLTSLMLKIASSSYYYGVGFDGTNEDVALGTKGLAFTASSFFSTTGGGFE
jgi:hypothetical protein